MKIGDEEVQVRNVRDNWALALMSQGVIVRLSMSRWRATSKLTHDELGLVFTDAESKQFMNQYIKLGYEKLLPPQVLRDMTSVEAHARRSLDMFCFDTVWGKFVPYSAFSDWKARNEEDKANFFDVARGIGNQYDQIIDEVKNEYRKMGIDVWNRLYPNNSGDPSESFLDSFVSRIIDKIPPREEIVASFKYETTFFVIPMPSMVQEDVSKARDVVLDQQLKEVDHNLEVETKRVIAEEYRKRKKELIDGFLESTVAYLRHYVSELSSTVLYILKKNEKDITGMHVKKLKNMIKKVDTLNFHNDTEVSDLLKDLDIEISKFKGERDRNVIASKLQQLISLAEEEYLPQNFNPVVDFIDIQ